MIHEIVRREEWTSILSSIDSYDFYHTFDYHKLCEKSGDRSVLLVFTEKSVLIAFPLIIRPIPGTDMYDATSVYGYPGPVSTGIPMNYNNSRFRRALSEYFGENSIVSVFSRLNPYIKEQQTVLNRIGDINIAGQVVGIDLQTSPAQQRERFSRSLKVHLNRARREISVRTASSSYDISQFCHIYQDSMDRLGASQGYLFPQDYFHGLLASPQIGAILLLAECKSSGETMAGSIFTRSDQLVQYHLGGTLSRFMDRMPSKLLIDEMRIRCSDGQYTYFNLGGGVGGNNDSLFYFKRRFSPNVRSFSLWRHIVNRKKYAELVGHSGSQLNLENAPFPEYRG